MKDRTPLSQLILYSIGCIFVLAPPIVGIFALWGFDANKVKNVLTLSTGSNSTSATDSNFSVTPGEDNILGVSTIKNDALYAHVTPKSNPAVSLRITSANIRGPIVHGNDGEELLRQGFWHYPSTVAPGEDGVSVIFGHRRYHLPPATDTFYNLDKVKNGDRVEIKLKDGTWLEYTVVKIEVIVPSNLDKVLQSQNNDSMIKFVTCTPLGTADQRLIVTAKKAF